MEQITTKVFNTSLIEEEKSTEIKEKIMKKSEASKWLVFKNEIWLISYEEFHDILNLIITINTLFMGFSVALGTPYD